MGITRYTWNPLTDSVIEETDGSGNVLVTYTNEPTPFGPLVSENRGGTTSYYHFDALGSTRLMTNSSQAVTDTATYDAWGKTVASIGMNPTQYRWCGRWGYQRSSSLGSDYVRGRTYQSVNARWTSIDPLRLGQGIDTPATYHLYDYGTNAPTSTIDPSGLDWLVAADYLSADAYAYRWADYRRMFNPWTTVQLPADPWRQTLQNTQIASGGVAVVAGSAATALTVGAYSGVTYVGNIVIPGTAAWSFLGPVAANQQAVAAAAAAAAAEAARNQRLMDDAQRQLAWFSNQIGAYPRTPIDQLMIERAEYWQREVDFFYYWFEHNR